MKLTWRAFHAIACRGVSALLVALCLALAPTTSSATTFATDASDLWWNAAEGGWGINVIQQDSILFITFFVYGANSQAVWYGGSETAFLNNNGGTLTYRGPLYQTSGPWLGGNFNPSSVSYRQVGTVTFALTSVSQALLTYTVDGVTVSKALTRYTWRNNSLGGTYLGASAGYISNCPGANGYVEGYSSFTISQSSNSFSLVSQAADGSGVTCSGSGPYSQSGRMGTASGSVSCSNGVGGTFSSIEIEGSLVGVTARTTTVYSNGCRAETRIAGVRRNF